MPVVMGKGDREQHQKSAGQTAVVGQKTAARSSDAADPEARKAKVVIALVVVAVVFALFMYRAYVVPSGVKIPHKVAPLPGFADQYPYNTKEWQDAYKRGEAGLLSGVPRRTIIAPEAGAQNSPAPGGTR